MTYASLISAGRATALKATAADATWVGGYATIYGLVVLFGWIGAMKFTAYEAVAIGRVEPAPILTLRHPRSARCRQPHRDRRTRCGAAPRRPAWSAVAGAVGAVLVAATTAVTLTFLFTAPGWEPSLDGFPALSVVPGQFLVKDAVLFGAALWILGDALDEIRAVR